jgi:8-oxo-dGTP diphosphatase
MRFCPRCGGPLDGPPPTTCGLCRYQMFVNPRPTATVVVVEDGSFLALRRAVEPAAGAWELPGGFCDGWEHPADAAVREAREELGIGVELGELVGMYLGSYAFQGEEVPVLDCFWLASIRPDDQKITINPDESSEFAWFRIDHRPALGFRTMELAMDEVAMRLAG